MFDVLRGICEVIEPGVLSKGKKIVWEDLIRAGYIDKDGVIQPKFNGKREDFNLDNPSLPLGEIDKIFNELQEAHRGQDPAELLMRRARLLQLILSGA